MPKRGSMMLRLRSVALAVVLVPPGLGGGTGCQREVSYPAGLTWGDPPLPTYTSQPRLGVTCNGDDTIAFVAPAALDQPLLLGAASVGSSPIEIEGPHHLTS